MISRIDHVSLAVKDYDKASRFFQTVFGAIPGANEEDTSMKYFWQLFSLGDLSRLELLKMTGEESFLKNFLENKTEGGVHHITLETPSIEKIRLTLETHNIPYFGFRVLGERWKELFIHPKDAFGVLIQIAEFHPEDWLAQSVKFSGNRRFGIIKNEQGYRLDFAHPGGGKISLNLSRDEVRHLINDLKSVIDDNISENDGMPE
ncbi:MAG: VOC family protein [Syntrophales bacterium]|jgi:methylmalonyl-CoA/ethylmalonyl-CoA epimerase|nr:VOC family protein [Syntrophales bacterium]MDY0043870.1 VOC family protein [Syntrophales bacterium]